MIKKLFITSKQNSKNLEIQLSENIQNIVLKSNHLIPSQISQYLVCKIFGK